MQEHTNNMVEGSMDDFLEELYPEITLETDDIIMDITIKKDYSKIKELDKRKPGTSSVTTPRKESDEVQILSGIFEGKTDGTPITGVVFNKNQHSKDYSMFKNTPRPSHGDFG